MADGNEVTKSQEESVSSFQQGINEAQKELDNKLQEKGSPEDALPETQESLDNISNQELSQQVEDRIAEGWEIDEVTDSGERVVMTTTEGGTIGGHALTGVLTGLTTFGLGNVAYGKLSKKKNKERIVLRADDESNTMVKDRESENPAELIRELKELNKDGLITDSEFEEKKKKLLDEI